MFQKLNPLVWIASAGLHMKKVLQCLTTQVQHVLTLAVGCVVVTLMTACVLKRILIRDNMGCCAVLIN